MQGKIRPALLFLCLSFSATSASLALPIGQRVTIELYNGAKPGTVIDYHPTTGESCVHVDGQESYENHWLYDKDIKVIGGTAPIQAPVETSPAKNTATQNQLQPWPKPDQSQARNQPNPDGKQRKYKIGQRVEYIEWGKWFKAVITGLRDDAYAPYHVHALGFIEQEHWAPESFIRAAGAGPTEPVPGGEANDDKLKEMRGGARTVATAGGGLPLKRYHAVFFVGDHLEDAAPFTITSSKTYTDSEGKLGTYNFDGGSSTFTFHGGNYDGQRAEYETSGGRARIHILGKNGNRIIDCD
jgi:hypothetical protein